MAELIIDLAILAVMCILSLWIIEQYFPKTAEKIENFLDKIL